VRRKACVEGIAGEEGSADKKGSASEEGSTSVNEHMHMCVKGQVDE
jgi:hypothetical protein